MPRAAGPACPGCGQGRVLAGKQAWGCSRWREGCGFRLDFVQDGVTIPPEEAGRLFGCGATLPLERPGQGRARLVLGEAGRVRWERH